MTNKLRLTACRIRTARGLVSRKNVKTARKPGGKPVTAVLGHFSAIHCLYYERPCCIEYTIQIQHGRAHVVKWLKKLINNS